MKWIMAKQFNNVLSFLFFSFILITIIASAQILSAKESPPLFDNIKGFERPYTLSINNGLISIDATGANIEDILEEISKKANIKISNFSTPKKITIFFTNLQLDEALKKLTNNQAVIYDRRKNEEGYKVSEIIIFPSSKRSVTKSGDGTILSHSQQYVIDLKTNSSNKTNSIRNNFIVNNKKNSNKGSGKIEFVPNELVIRFKRSLSTQMIDKLISSIGAIPKKKIKPLNYYVLSLPPHLSVKEAMGLFSQQRVVDKVEPNYIIPLKVIPVDPKFSSQWALNNSGQNNGIEDADIDAPEAWNIELGRSDVVIAVIDTGVDYTHEDLAANIWNNAGEIPNNGVDDDGNGYIDDTMGWDFVDSYSGASDEDFEIPDNDPMDRHGHGTHVAGIAAAVGNNARGISGVAWNCKIMPVRAGYKTSSGGGVLNSVDASQAIIYAAENGARVINLSWGDYQKSNLIEDALDFATNIGALICAASGNESSGNFLYPAASGNNALISVGATNTQDKAANFSNYGDWVDISAPGVDIISTCPNNSYCNMSGTSMATPHVAGLAALIFSYFPSINPLEVKARIMRSSDIIADLQGKNSTSGRINAYTGLTAEFDSPHIFSIGPIEAREGDQITILGDCFGSDQGSSIVQFSPGQESEIISWSNSSIICKVPEDSLTGEIKVKTDKGISNAINITILIKYYKETLIEQEFQGGGQARAWKADDQSWKYELPFTFPFFEEKYNTVYVCSNGYLDFTQNAASYFNSTETFKNRVMIAPLWDDLVTNGPSIQGEDIYISKPSSDSVCFRWVAERYETGDPVNVEVILFKNGQVKFNYGAGNRNISSTIGLSGGDHSRYLLASYDGANNLTEVKSILFTPVEQAFTIPLDLGWNLISFPFKPENNHISQIMSGMYDGIESMWGFTDGVWHLYDPQNPGFSNLEAIDTGMGYWVKTIQEGLSFKIQGKGPTSLSLKEGWNLIGFNFIQTKSVQEALLGIDGNVLSIWGYSDGTWRLYDLQNLLFSNLEKIEPGKGYWIKFHDDSNL